jgi:hypothetical protein
MMIAQVFLLKLIVSHLLTDFVLQPDSWIHERYKKHFASGRLYLHGLITAAVPLLLVGIEYWPVAVIILVTHIIIDGWKSYQKQSPLYFVIDQTLHLLVIAACWYYLFVPGVGLVNTVKKVSASDDVWIFVTAVVFLTVPAGILIGQLTRSWREQITNPESLANAGKWIGIIERLIVFIFVLLGQYAAISLLIAAKGIIRFNEKDRPEVKTEYLVIGTLMSIGIALIIGQTVKHLLHI